MSNDSALRYRPAMESDWPTVHTLLTASGLPLAGAHACFADFLIVESNGEVVGCVGLERHGIFALLRSCAVATGYRDRSIGKTLTRNIITLAKTRGIEQLVLLTTTAEDFFMRYGFVKIDRADVPPALKATDEFFTACPESATVMRLII